jgi:hypothetical protein
MKVQDMLARGYEVSGTLTQAKRAWDAWKAEACNIYDEPGNDQTLVAAESKDYVLVTKRTKEISSVNADTLIKELRAAGVSEKKLSAAIKSATKVRNGNLTLTIIKKE